MESSTDCEGFPGKAAATKITTHPACGQIAPAKMHHDKCAKRGEGTCDFAIQGQPCFVPTHAEEGRRATVLHIPAILISLRNHIPPNGTVLVFFNSVWRQTKEPQQHLVTGLQKD